MAKKHKISITILMIVYLLLLTWIIVFKGSTGTFEVIFMPNFRSLSLIPIFNRRETLLNILAFIPLGIYMRMLATKQNLLRQTLIIASVSLFYEAMQYVLAVGASDITDLITNTVGGLIGLLIYFLLGKLLKSKTEIICTICACIGTVVLSWVVFTGNLF